MGELRDLREDVPLCLQDTLNERSIAAVDSLMKGRWKGSSPGRDAKRVVMLTGDNAASAGRIAELVGISDVRAVRHMEPSLFSLHMSPIFI